MSKTHTVEINGKRYDALSGKILTGNDKPKPVTTQIPGTHIDGFSLKHRSKPSPQAAHPQRQTAHVSPKVHHKADRSHTLMRSAVAKPAVHRPKSPAATPMVIPHTLTEQQRLERAKQSKKNPQVSRFGIQLQPLKKLSQILSVKEPPQEEPLILSHAALPVGTSIVSPFDTALHNASSHTQPKLKKPHIRARAAKRLRVSTKILNAGVASLTVLILGSYIAYQNVPNFSMRIAATRAGVHASLPGYQPSGFSLRGPIEAQPGQITLTYLSNSDNRQFTISQHNSSWTNESLVENYVAINQRPYQTYQASDKTIYMYDGNNATWVNNGIWYKVEGNSSLNSDQLLRLANSL